MSHEQRIAITGLGLVSPLGIGALETWKQICGGATRLDDASALHAGALSCGSIAKVHGFDVQRWSKSVQLRKLDPMIQFAVAAASEAFDSAGLHDVDQRRIGCVLGNSNGGLSSAESAIPVLIERGPRRVSPYLAISMYYAGCIGQVSIELGLRGPMTLLATGETAGGDALALAMEWLREGEADVILAGGTEAPLTPHCLAAYEQLGVLSNTGPETDVACQSWEGSDSGLVLGEGSAVMALERWDHARRRGACIFAELAGSAEGALRPGVDPGREVARTIEAALSHAAVDAEELDLVQGNGDGIAGHDRAEAEALRETLGSAAMTTPVTTAKARIGNAVAASAAVEAVCAVLAMQEGVVPPLPARPRVFGDLDFVSGRARSRTISAALCLSIGIQGRIRALVLRHVNAPESTGHRKESR